jgi:phosphohistidine phosphatase
MRHGKSDRDSGTTDDFSRPLSRRGLRDAPRIGKWLAENGLIPAYIACSPAVRTNETALLVCNGADISTDRIYHDERLYLASLGDLLAVLRDISAGPEPLMLIGHNPGLEDLLLYLAGDAAAHSGRRKIMPTAALAHLQFTGNTPAPGSVRLLTLLRPRELPAS